jgi:hypothetical protein
VEAARVSQSSIDVDVLDDEGVQGRLAEALATLVAAEPSTQAA